MRASELQVSIRSIPTKWIVTFRQDPVRHSSQRPGPEIVLNDATIVISIARKLNIVSIIDSYRDRAPPTLPCGPGTHMVEQLGSHKPPAPEELIGTTSLVDLDEAPAVTTP